MCIVVVVKLQGGLGNQLFQTAFAQQLAARGDDVVLDARIYARKHIHAGFVLGEHVELPFAIATASDLRALRLCRSWTWHEIRRRFGDYGRRVVVEDQTHFDPTHLERRYDFYDGYWQDERYFPSAGSAMRDLLGRVPLDDTNARLRDAITRGPAISLHVRRGDYAQYPVFAPLCEQGYYQRALEHLRARVANARLFVFSDDLAWCRANLGGDATYVDHNTGPRCIFDLLLMSVCSHHVVANSTFSWWGAWLDGRPSRTVVAPARWFTDDAREAALALPGDWYRV